MNGEGFAGSRWVDFPGRRGNLLIAEDVSLSAFRGLVPEVARLLQCFLQVRQFGDCTTIDVFVFESAKLGFRLELSWEDFPCEVVLAAASDSDAKQMAMAEKFLKRIASGYGC